jgi:hypothetical protein
MAQYYEQFCVQSSDKLGSWADLTFGFRVYGYVPARAPKSREIQVRTQTLIKYKKQQASHYRAIRVSQKSTVAMTQTDVARLKGCGWKTSRLRCRQSASQISAVQSTTHQHIAPLARCSFLIHHLMTSFLSLP